MILFLRCQQLHEGEGALLDDEGHLLFYEQMNATPETFFSLVCTKFFSQLSSLHDLHGIVAIIGPGSFTMLRLVSILIQSLEFHLRIPVYGKENSTQASLCTLMQKEIFSQANIFKQTQSENLPLYGSCPHITIQKKALL